MKLKEFRKDAHEFTAKLSDINRNLAFAGIAIIWIFRTQTESSISIPKAMLLPLLFIVLALAFDILQYLYSSIIWTNFHKKKETEGVNGEDEIKAPKWYSRISYVLFYTKVTFNLLGFIIMFLHISSELFK